MTHGRQRKHGWIGDNSEEQNVDIADQGSKNVEHVMSSLAPTSLATNSPFQPQFVPPDSNVYTSQNTNRAFLQNSKQLVGGMTLIMLVVGISSWICIICCYHLHRRKQRQRLQRQTSSFGSSV